MTAIRSGHRYRDCLSQQTLDTWFPADNKPLRRHCLAQTLGLIDSDIVSVEVGNYSEPPNSTEQAYLRLHLLSECAVAPNDINLEGIFTLLPVVAWTSAGPLLPERVPALRALLQDRDHHLTVSSIDKFPQMSDYVIPSGVRIANADRVRLGAHLAAGTTVMHEGFVNFNAGSLGECMIEGRVTPGVVVGAGSDIGGGASIMGTLSGGGKRVNAIGERVLLGANAGVGISLGNDCIVEAGLYLTAGSKVRTDQGIVRASELSGVAGLLFRRNSQSGAIEAIANSGLSWQGLNSALHRDQAE